MVQEDGKIVAAGYMGHDNAKLAALARLRADGSLDDTFGNHGFTLNGDLGQWTGRNTARYAFNPWRNGGRVTTQTVGAAGQINAVAVQADGAIIAAGAAASSGDATPWLARYLGVGTVSSDATLSALAVASAVAGAEAFDNAGTLSPVFASETLSYQAALVADSTHFKITPTTSHDAATVVVQGVQGADEASYSVAEGESSPAIEVASEKLESGAIVTEPISTTARVVVTAQDGVTIATYNLTLRFESTNPAVRLWIQTSTDGSTYTDYPSTVPASRRSRCGNAPSRPYLCRFGVYDETNPVTHFKLVPATDYDHVTIRINDVEVASGAATTAFSFAGEEDYTGITLESRAENGSALNYDVEVLNRFIRERTDETNAELDQLIGGGGAVGGGGGGGAVGGGAVGGGGGAVGGGDVNQAPSFGQTSPVELRVAENTPSGSAIGAPVAATDPEGDSLRYSLSGSDLFEIDPQTGQITVGDGADLDYETEPNRYALTVSATDPDGSRQTARVTVNVTVTDITLPPAVAAYDADNDERVCLPETLQAVADFDDGTLSAEALRAVIRAYLNC